MKRLCLTFVILVFGLLGQTQNISVKDFYYAENDLTARTYGTSVEDKTATSKHIKHHFCGQKAFSNHPRKERNPFHG